jgi:ribosome-binding factor A
VGDRIAEEMALLLQREVEDPRLSMVTVTGVEVDRELAYATIYVSALDAEERIEEVLEALNGARGFLRSRLASAIPLRSFPQLRFRQDTSAYRGARVEELLQQLEEERQEGEDELE